MNYVHATRLLRARSRNPGVDARHPAVRHGAGDRLSGLHSLPLATAIITRRVEPLANRRGTDFYNTGTLPLQFFTEPGRASELPSGAQRLMFAVLQDAVACWFRWRNGGTARKRRLFQETYDWFWESNPSGLYAFENICDVLKLDPDYIRRGLTRWHPYVQEPQTEPARHQPIMLTRRSAISPAKVLHAPRLAPRRSGTRRK